MGCQRFETDGMKFLDGEMTSREKNAYEMHVKSCPNCASELKELGRIVDLTREIELREPDEVFWASYWSSIYRRLERNTGFMLIMVGLIAVLLFALFKAVTSPAFLTFKGLSIAALILGLVVVFLSVVRERYHERKSDPYRGIEQ